MHAIGIGSQVFLLYLLVLLPWVAFRSAKAFNAPEGSAASRPMPSLSQLYANTIAVLGVLFLLAWFTARSFGFAIFAAPHIGVRDALAGGGALLFCFALILVSRAIRTPEEFRDMPVNRLLPGTARERALWSMTAVGAGIAEEAAYRGVLMSILSYALGSPWIAVCVAATAFALGHALQGWKSMTVIFAIALTMHALVWFTGTLVVAMAVHAAYDLLAPGVRRALSRGLPGDPGTPAAR